MLSFFSNIYYKDLTKKQVYMLDAAWKDLFHFEGIRELGDVKRRRYCCDPNNSILKNSLLPAFHAK